jgi:hypothetical protein
LHDNDGFAAFIRTLYCLLCVGSQLAGTRRALALPLDRIHDVLFLRQKCVAQISGPLQILVHHR